ncbi:thiol-disulfide oxidoreductase DCC family protein [Oceanisphaera sp.]|uniref:thiol-disulfide oxidoreductase DCC family protein n=1 Tax=Oceanisphaera sp. TaxID=1929979 RepID=UPI003A90C43C
MTLAADQRPILLFDGVCNLCTGSVRFVIQRDREKRFLFASLQSSIAKELLEHNGVEPADYLGSIVLIDGNGIWLRSTAALRTAGRLSGLWPLMQVFLLVPRPLRDWVYDFVGARRYRWFGRTHTCWVPAQDVSDRFLDARPIPDTEQK